MTTLQLPDALIPWGVVRRLIGIGRTTVWQLRRNGQFPQPRRVGQRQLWFVSDITAWQAALPVAAH